MNPSIVFDTKVLVVIVFRQKSGRIVAQIINNDLECLPYADLQDPAFFRPLTQEPVRTLLFNMVLAQAAGGTTKTYARKVTCHHEKTVGPFLCLELTSHGYAQARKFNNMGCKVRYSPEGPNARYQWSLFTPYLKKVLTALKLKPVEK